MRKKTTQVLCGASIALLAALCFGCSPKRINKAEIERDLAIEAELLGEATILPGQQFALRMSLVNRSKRKSYLVVRPGDGSGVTSGAREREPYVFFSAQRQRQHGNWEAVPTCEISYVHDTSVWWREDVIELKAGERLALKDGLPLPSRALELQKPGRVHLYVHYRFSPHFKPDVRRNHTLVTLRTAEGKSQRLPPFEIISDPIELYVHRPLNLHVEAISPLKIGMQNRLSEVLRVELSNVSDAPIRVKSPRLRASTLLRFETRPWRGPRIDTSGSTHGPETVLAPGGVVSLLGDGELANGTDGHWILHDTNTFQLRAVYTTTQYASAEDGPISVIKSNWTTVSAVE